jgi:hypothetical protein
MLRGMRPCNLAEALISSKIQLGCHSARLRRRNPQRLLGYRDRAVPYDIYETLIFHPPCPTSFSNAVLIILPGKRPTIEVAYRISHARDDAMFVSEHYDPAALIDRLRGANAATPELIAEVIDLACRRFPSTGQTAKTARIEQLIDARAWTDLALALIDLELPLWQVRRIAYDEGEWYCALSRERELPDWLDQSIEAQHADITVAILGAFVEAQRITASATRPSVPFASAQREASPLYEPLCCNNFD